ncbi:TetR/AcrR family transcriptional regulator [Bermanella marisrubri]|uniref:TetR/AcrR family transcriptional regulator n=1 Tax=Bermanella marisrubri TaxID=207949 RepID=UPI001401F1C1|nr:TetR/AcrR family transcriptional regulator [Bermanella marisrubri]QIZ83940.1 TetR/AcrR family transcriptional regulator [Bermanella marisrubri]
MNDNKIEITNTKKSPKRLSPEQRKQQLLLDAIPVFANRGIGRAAHADVAQKSGVSVATAFNYFNTREELVDAVLDYVAAYYIDLAKSFHHKEEAVDNPARVLQDHAVAFIGCAHSEPDLVKIWLEWGASVRDDCWPKYLRFQEEVLDIIEPTIANGLQNGHMQSQLTARELAQILFGQAHPISLASFAPNPPTQNMMRFVQLGMQALLGIK